jgi:hypothetical protein
MALVAIAWPKPLWHPDEVALSHGLPRDISELQERAKAAGQKVDVRLFQRAPGMLREPAELICISAAGGRSLHHNSIPIAEIARRAARFLTGEDTGPALGTPQILVCTDGKHDRCCATHGREMYEALRARAAAHPSRIEVAESSHLGGHRFAANCIVLPEARMYGRLRPEDAPAFIASIEEERVYLSRYRGRLGLGEAQQVAEAQVLSRHPQARALEFGEPEPGDGRVRVPVSFENNGVTYRTQVLCHAQSFRSAPSCSPDAEPETRTRLIERSRSRSSA